MYPIIYKYIFVSSIAGVNRTRRRSDHCKNLCTCIILYRTYVAGGVSRQSEATSASGIALDEGALVVIGLKL